MRLGQAWREENCRSGVQEFYARGQVGIHQRLAQGIAYASGRGRSAETWSTKTVSEWMERYRHSRLAPRPANPGLLLNPRHPLGTP